ncbi:MAG: hypothetical protein AAGH99_00255 [Planctomycetota bacterium]
MNVLCLLLAQAGGAPAAAGDPTKWLIWGIVLLAVALALFFVEVFLPTGGIIGATSGLCAVAGIIFLFWRDSTLGLAAAAGVILVLPFAIFFALKVMPDTPFAKWVTLKDAQEPLTRQGVRDAAAEEHEITEALQRVMPGDTGETLTPLYPVGTCLIGGRREECLAERGTIGADQKIRVIRVDGSEIFVAAVEG